MPKLKPKILGDFYQWKATVEKDGHMSEGVFYNIFQHYSTLHDKEKALAYALETAGKVEEAAGVKKKAGEYTTFEHKGVEVKIPDFLLESWIKKAEKLGIISVELHEGHVRAYIEKYTNLTEELGLNEFKEFVFALETYIAGKAGFKVNPELPVTFRNKLVVGKDSVTFSSEKYGSKDVPLHLYYKWLGSFLSNKTVDKKTYSEMQKYAKSGSEKEISTASFDFYKKFITEVLAKPENMAAEYPEYFAVEFEKMLMEETEKLAKLDVKPPKGEAGKIVEMPMTGRIRIKLKGLDYTVGVDADIYHLVYSETAKNGGKAPSWANLKLYNYLVKKGGYYEDDAAAVAPLLVSYFEYQVAKDAEAARNIVEKGEKLKAVPYK